MKKKHLLAAAAAGIMAFAMLGSCAFAEEAEEENSTETCKSYLTGETVSVSVGRKRPVALMLNNIYDAIPQYGIENAAIVYEAEVEGLITRLMGIFEDYKDVDRIGSIRSCRPYFIYYAREFNAMYGHFGQAIYAIPVLQLPTTANISGIPEYGLAADGELAYYRSDDRPSPHNVFTNYNMLKDSIKSYGYSRKYNDGYTGHYKFAEDGQQVNLDKGFIAKVVLPGYTYNHARFDYHPEDGLYYRSQYGDAQIDGGTGRQLAYKNIIIQSCESTPFDDNGYLWTDPRGSGSGWFITNGRAEKISWVKDGWSAEDPVETTIEAANLAVDVRECDFNVTRYYDADGNEITLNQGKTWVCIVRNSNADHVIISDDPTIDSYAIDF